MLVTRPEPGASETAQRLRVLGFEAVLAPLLRILPLAIRMPPGVAATLVASGNAIPALPATLHGVPMLAVGDATAARARAAGFLHVASAGGDAADLAALAARNCRPGAALLLAAARGQGVELARALRVQGFVVHRRAAYAAQPAGSMPQAALRAMGGGGGGLLAALFLSAETAAAFVRLLPAAAYPLLAGMDALVIGEAAAVALRVLPWRRVRVSAKPNLDSILAML